MNNERFMLLTGEEKSKKFRTALKNKTDNGLNDSEIDRIISVLPQNQQYIIRVYNEPYEFCSMLALSDAQKSSTLLGSAVPGVPELSLQMFCPYHPCAYLTRNKDEIINIFIPKNDYAAGGITK